MTIRSTCWTRSIDACSRALCHRCSRLACVVSVKHGQFVEAQQQHHSMDVPSAGRKQQGQDSHECKQYKRPLPSPLFIACTAMTPSFSSTPDGTCNAEQSRLPPSATRPLCCGRPSSTFTPMLTIMELRPHALLIAGIAVPRPGAPSCCCTIHHRHARWSKGFDHQLHSTAPISARQMQR